MISRYKVTGHSMEPNFRNGDKLLVSSLFFNLKKNDVVVFRHGQRSYLKRINAVVKNRLLLTGDNKNHSGRFNIDRSQIKGKLLMKY